MGAKRQASGCALDTQGGRGVSARDLPKIVKLSLRGLAWSNRSDFRALAWLMISAGMWSRSFSSLYEASKVTICGT